MCGRESITFNIRLLKINFPFFKHNSSGFFFFLLFTITEKRELAVKVGPTMRCNRVRIADLKLQIALKASRSRFLAVS